MKLLQNGIGHTMNLHTQDEKIVREFAVKPASRILVNTGGSMGGTGLSTGLAPAFTLGCGTMGGSSVSENVTPLHLINKKTVCYGIKEATTLLSDDPTFHANGASCMASQPCPSVPVPPISYSAGCQSCGCDVQSPASFANNPAAAAHAASVAGTQIAAENIDSRNIASSEEGINLEQLKDMINGLVNAMKGE
jgi:acetaldehyde dehydrogenase (acetylating)